MAKPRGTRTRKINWRALVQAAAGEEKPYPIYTFSGKTFTEKPKHNPFTGL
jgi:hypothetical protein